MLSVGASVSFGHSSSYRCDDNISFLPSFRQFIKDLWMFTWIRYCKISNYRHFECVHSTKYFELLNNGYVIAYEYQYCIDRDEVFLNKYLAKLRYLTWIWLESKHCYSTFVTNHICDTFVTDKNMLQIWLSKREIDIRITYVSMLFIDKIQ
jgi:hypothetical protein